MDADIRVDFMDNVVPELGADGMTIMRRTPNPDIREMPSGIARQFRTGLGRFRAWARDTNLALREALGRHGSDATASWAIGHPVGPGSRIHPARASSLVYEVPVPSRVAGVAPTVERVMATPLDLLDPHSGRPGSFNMGWHVESYVNAAGVTRERLVIEVYDF